MKAKRKGATNPQGQKTAGPPVRNSNTGTAERPLLIRIDEWTARNRKYLFGALIGLWILVRVIFLLSLESKSLDQLYRWSESDSAFFDVWARRLAAGDWLNGVPIHPYHGWHREFADQYFKENPTALQEILAAHPQRDSTFAPGKARWDSWYGGARYHQEPLYAYVLAFLYALTGNGVWAMLVLQAILGVCSGMLLWLVTRRYFSDTVAVVGGLLYAICGILLFQEALILRTSWTVFFALMTVWMTQRAFDRRTAASFLIGGAVAGLAFLLQSFFLLFFIGAMALYGTQEGWRSKPVPRRIGLYVAGFGLAFLPVVVRNATVGAPLFSTTSVGAVTFVVTNVDGTNAVSRWQPEAAKAAGIMGKSAGKFGPAALAALGSHDGPGSYLALLGRKVQALLNAVEWPNNENYYFYREALPLLRLTFFNFFWIAALGLAGLAFSVHNRRKTKLLYLAIGVQLLVLVGFYVLGRLRTPLAVLLLPFAAYALVELAGALGRLRDRAALTRIGIVVASFLLVFLCYSPKAITRLDRTDYDVLYELVYFDRVKNHAEARQWKAALDAHGEFLNLEPRFIKDLRATQVVGSPAEIQLVEYFAGHYQIHGYLYEDSGNKQLADKMAARFTLLKAVADNSKKTHFRN